MKLNAIFVATLSVLGFSSQAAACTDFEIFAQPFGVEVYNPNTLAPATLQIELILPAGPAQSSCASHKIELVSQTSYGVRDLSDGRATIDGTIPADQSAFAAFNDTTIRLSQAAVDELIATGRFVFDYSWIQPGQFFPVGTYTNVLDVNVNGAQVTSVEPELAVSPAVRLLGDVSSGYGQVDFGALESFEEATVNFIYQSNAELSVTAQSQNGERLVHEDGARVYAVPYSTYINDAPVVANGASRMNLGSETGRQSIGTIRLQLGDIGTPVAGEYADVLILSFTAN